MTVSECCGAGTKVEYRPEHPFVYDDPYVLKVPVVICAKCGNVLGQKAIKPHEDEQKN